MTYNIRDIAFNAAIDGLVFNTEPAGKRILRLCEQNDIDILYTPLVGKLARAMMGAIADGISPLAIFHHLENPQEKSILQYIFGFLVRSGLGVRKNILQLTWVCQNGG